MNILSQIPNYQSWINNTKIRLGKRSNAMRLLDQAILNFQNSGTDQNAEKIKTRLSEWQKTKGFFDQWKKSS